MAKRIIFLIALIFPLNVLSIQNKFSYITSENGLSQGNVTCIFQDSKGFMWFGTYSGLNRFNGYTTKVYDHVSNDSLSLSHEHITKITEDGKGKIWVATNGGGISVFHPEDDNFTRIEEVSVGENIVRLRNISDIKAGPDEQIWATDENLGLFIFDPQMNLVKSYLTGSDNPGTLPNQPVHGILFDTSGVCWLGVGNGTLCKLIPGSDLFEYMVFEDRVATADDGIRSMYRDKDGRFWIGTTSQGAYMFDPVSKNHINFRQEDPVLHLSGNTVMAFCDDWDGNMLIGIDGGGINILNRSNGAMDYIYYDPGNPESLSTNAVYALYIDQTETLWVGTYAGGINYQGRYRYKFQNFKPNPSDTNSLSYKNVRSIIEDRNGDLWIGTDGGGLNNFGTHRNSFKRYRANPEDPNWLHTDVIIHMMQDSDGDIFIGSYARGLTIFNPETETFKQYLPNDTNANSISGSHAWYIFQDSYGIIWVGLLAVGLDRFDKETETFTNYPSISNDPTTLNSPNVKIIYEDSERNMWVGTEGGGLHLYNRDKDNFTRYFYDPDTKGSISNDDVREIYEDTKGRLWIGTSNGLNLMHRDSTDVYFDVYTEADGLPNNVIDGILEDDEGNLWISTNMGITRFNPEEITFRNYDKSDGLQGNEFNYTAELKSSSGVFYFGGLEGFNAFRPEDIKDNPNIPNIVLTDFQIFNKSVSKVKVRKRGKKVYRSITEIDEIKISYKENVISFEFAALDYANPGKNKYKYMLEGFDKEWTETSADKRYASYTNLDGGKYVFRVMGSNSDGLWNEKGLSIGLKVTPPFWKRKSFIIIALLVITYLIYRYVRERQNKVIRDKKILEEKIKTGLEELEKQKNEALKKSNELEEKIESEKEQNWYNVGMAGMSDVMSKNKDDLQKFSQSIITETVEYLEVQQGAIYLLNDEDENDPYLNLIAAYAPDDDRLSGKRIELQESQIGACFTEKKVIRVDNLPEDYASITSGLGESPLKYLVIIPIQLNELAIGVIELISYERVGDYRVEFVAKAGETMTAILTSLKANEQTKKLLEKQRQQAEEMSSQEEELRQNLEEMQATQEEAARKAEELSIFTSEFEVKEKEYLDRIAKLEKENKKLKKK
jgi:ligand-binding sensor domain-containing protein